MKFKIKEEQKEESLKRNIMFTKELFTKINSIKGNVSLNKFVIQAMEYALNNMEDK